MLEVRIVRDQVEEKPFEPLPLDVPADWDEQLAVGERLAKLIDKHLDYESPSAIRSDWMTPGRLCPGQRVALVSDMSAVTR